MNSSQKCQKQYELRCFHSKLNRNWKVSPYLTDSSVFKNSNDGLSQGIGTRVSGSMCGHVGRRKFTLNNDGSGIKSKFDRREYFGALDWLLEKGDSWGSCSAACTPSFPRRQRGKASEENSFDPNGKIQDLALVYPIYFSAVSLILWNCLLELLYVIRVYEISDPKGTILLSVAVSIRATFRMQQRRE